MQVGDPRSPIRRGQVDTPGEAYGVAVSGAYAYVADYDHGLHVVDISDPEAPSIVATVLPGGYAMGVTIDAQLAYVAAYHGGLVIIDIADPLSPEIRGRYDRLADDLRFRDVAVQGQRAYAAGFTFERGGLLSVIDVADPAAPFLLGEVVTGTSGTGVAVWEQHAYCAAVGLAVVDVSIPDSPRLLGRVGDEASGDVALAASCIVLADPDSGIRTYPLQCAGPNAVALASFSAAATPVGLLLSWVTGWENDHAGFHVERAAEGTADYDRLTRTLITPPGPYRFLDAGVAPGSTWNYRLVAVSLSGESTVHGPITATAGPMSSARGGLRLAAHPNPWPASRNLEIVYEAGPPAPIQLRIFDPAGRLVRALSVQTSERGAQSLHWDGRDASGRIIPAGVYFLELEAAGQRITSKLARVQ